MLDLIGTSFGGSFMMTRNVLRFLSRDFKWRDAGQSDPQGSGLDPRRGRGWRLLFSAPSAEQRFVEARAPVWGDEDMAALVVDGESRPATKSARDENYTRCRALPRICPCCGRSWTSTTDLALPPRPGFQGSSPFVHALDRQRLAGLLTQHSPGAILFDPIP